MVIGSNRLKGHVLELGITDRLVALIDIQNGEVSREALYLVNSLAKGTEAHLKCLVGAQVVPVLLKNTHCEDIPLLEANLLCLKTIFKSRFAPVHLIFTLPCARNPLSSSFPVSVNHGSTHPPILNLMGLALANSSSKLIKECVASILADACQVSYIGKASKCLF